MKKFILLFTLALFSLGYSARAQVNILAASDSAYMFCTGSLVPIDFYIYATTTGYTSADAPTITIDFGDGTDTTYVDPNFATYFPDVVAYCSHTYLTSGSYDVTYTVTMPDLQADTVIVYNEVTIAPCEIISGNIYYDENSNCIFDGLDTPVQIYVSATESLTGDYVNFAMADATGYYEMLVPVGVSVDLSLYTYASAPIYVCPASGFITTTAPSSGNDFALNGSAHDLIPVQFGGFMHPGFTEAIKINVWDMNLVNTPDVQLRVVVSDPLVTFVSGIAAGGDIVPDISGDTLTWDIPAAYISNYLIYYGGGPSLTMNFTTDISAPLGSQICFDVIVEPIAGDTDPGNNFQTMCFPVLNAYDPNYVEVAPHGTTNAGLIDPNLDLVYTVHFQNTGNFPATNILIKDSLDISVHDLGTFEYLGSSHTVTNIISSGDGAMVFEFDNINLPDSTSDEPNSHGWITYRIKQQPDLAPTTTLENTAYIYFDFNAPITTNTALNTIKNPLSIVEPITSQNHLSIYPVPSGDAITVLINSTENTTYQIIDLNGNVVMRGSVVNGTQLSVSDLSNGIYFFKLENGEVEKLIIQK